MGIRSITDQEIGLIKAMLARGMKNRDIQFYFNRQDRPVNSGRITQIKDGSYGPKVAPSSTAELNAFLASFTPSAVGVILSAPIASPEPTLVTRAEAMFERRGRTGWFLKTHETDEAECKENFCLKPENRFADPLRSVAGLANNGGGFVFFGVSELPDGSLQAVGLPDDTFAKTDPAEINRCLAGALDPVPIFRTCTIELEGKKIGVVHVEKHDHPPVMAVKNVGSEIKEGAIYFRYVGETRVIKPGELRQIIAHREQKAVAEFARNMSKVASGAVATLDLDTGRVEGRSGRFVIGEELLPKLQFIREGEFKEATGAPTLRLIGDVAAVGTGPTITIRGNVTDEAVLLNFLRGQTVAEPMQYILHSAHTSREWLPLFYYVAATGQPRSAIIAALKDENAGQPTKRDAAVRRLSAKGGSAFQKASGKAKAALSKAMDGSLEATTSRDEVSPTSLAIQAIPATAAVDFTKLKAVLLAAYELVRGGTPKERALRSNVYRAACRLDELEFGPDVAGRNLSKPVIEAICQGVVDPVVVEIG